MNALIHLDQNGKKVMERRVHDAVMKERADIIHAKFAQNPTLAQALIDTGDADLIEGNTWNDNYWGVCECARCRSEGIKGQNKLGQILMAERKALTATPISSEELKDGELH